MAKAAKARVVAKKARTIKKPTPSERKRQRMELGELDEDAYDEEGRELLEEGDEIAPEEEGFLKGYDEGEKVAKCAKCGKPLLEDFVEKEIGDETYRFCSDEHAESFEPEVE